MADGITMVLMDSSSAPLSSPASVSTASAAVPTAPELLRLAPALVGRARRGVVGSSRYATSLREAVRQAAADSERRAVLISGEPGLEKDNLAALIHFGSADRHQLMARLDGGLLRPDGADLFGLASGGAAAADGAAPEPERPLLEDGDQRWWQRLRRRFGRAKGP